MTHLALTTDEPAIGIIVPMRLLPQLVALLAAAADAGSCKPCVETTAADEAPTGPGIVKASPSNPANVVPLRRTA